MIKGKFCLLEQDFIMHLLFSFKFKKFIFLLPLIIFVNSAYAEETKIQMDWLIEGQLEKQNITKEEFQIVSSYEELAADENTQTQKPVYTEFITNNKYSTGDYVITIDSEEGQILNGVLIEQRDLQDESFKHKIKYFDRFSDGYVEIAEALLDPIGNNKYLIDGRSLDYNPNSNLELFVLERGYTMDNLEAIPNDIFTPKEFTLGRAMLEDATRTGKGDFDLREFSPNYLRLNQEQIQERMMNAFSEQTSQIFDQIISGEKQPDKTLPNTGVAISQPTRDSQNIFDNFKFEQPTFENTIHVRDSLQDNSLQTGQHTQDFENISLLLLIPVFVGLAIFGYLMRGRLWKQKLKEPLLQVSKLQIDYRELTKDMLKESLSLYNNNQRKEAHETLSQAIRYYFSQNLGIYKEMTNFELLSHLRKSNAKEYDRIRTWLLLCGSVEYAKYKSIDSEFRNALSTFTNEVSRS